MKKLLGLLLVAVIAFPASAAVIKNVELKGEIQTIASDVKYSANNMFDRGAKTRAIAGFSFDVVEDVKANLLFQYAYRWGDQNYTNNGFAGAKGMRLVNANLVLSNLFCCLEATIGRQFYGEDNSPIIYFGPNHYNAEGMGLASALDGVTVRYSDDFKDFTLLAGKVEDIMFNYSGLGNFDLRANIFGADLKLHFSDALTTQVYGYDLTNEKVYYGKDNYFGTFEEFMGSDVVRGHTGFYGAKLNWNTDVLRMSAEYARNFDGHRLIKERHTTPYMVKADIATDIDAFTVRGTFVYSKGMFIALGNYAPGMIWGHYFGSLGFLYNVLNYGTLASPNNGARIFNVGVDVKPSAKWTLSLDGFSYQDRFARHSATLEADLTAKYAHTEAVEIFGGLAYAKNSAGIREFSFDATTENYKGQLGVLVRF